MVQYLLRKIFAILGIVWIGILLYTRFEYAYDTFRLNYDYTWMLAYLVFAIPGIGAIALLSRSVGEKYVKRIK